MLAKTDLSRTRTSAPAAATTPSLNVLDNEATTAQGIPVDWTTQVQGQLNLAPARALENTGETDAPIVMGGAVLGISVVAGLL